MTVDAHKIQAYAEASVTSVSLGIQDFGPVVQKANSQRATLLPRRVDHRDIAHTQN